MPTSITLAVGQSPGELTSTQQRIHWLSCVMPAVKKQNTDLLLLPELFSTGYNIGRLVLKRAEVSNGPTFNAIASLAKNYGVAIHYGFPEKENGLLYNSAQCIGPEGDVIGSHRKLVLPPGFETDTYSAGTTCKLFTYRGVKCATLICYDAEFPESVRHVATLGAQVVLVPTALGAKWGWVSQTMLPTRAYENGVFLAYANSAGCENGLRFLGQSFIAAPDGIELARAGSDSEIIYADCDIARVDAAQTRLPYLRDYKQFKR